MLQRSSQPGDSGHISPDDVGERLYLERIRAALAEVGVDPQIPYIWDGRIEWNPGRIDAQVIWRATEVADYGPLLCLACAIDVEAADPENPLHLTPKPGCIASRRLDLDCGRLR